VQKGYNFAIFTKVIQKVLDICESLYYNKARQKKGVSTAMKETPPASNQK